MRCAVVHIFGEDLENLVLEDRSDLEATGEDVRVRVTATALNRADLLQRRGLYPAPPGVPEAIKDIPGLEFMGRIDQIGDRVGRWQGGERVMGIVPGGGYADQVVTHEALLIPAPERLSDPECAAVPEAFITAFDALALQAGVRADERVLIHAVASGVGTAAVQLVDTWGGRAIGTSGSRHKLDAVAEITKFFPINYRESDFQQVIEDEFGKNAVDVVLDVVGATYWERNIAVLGAKGRLVLIGRLGGSEAKTNLASVMSKRLRIMGSVMRPRSLDEKSEVVEKFIEHVVPLFEHGRIKPVIDSIYAFEDIHRATARMENNENIGKIVLKMDG
jgi:putative PIG3 family NAD(P)H quinone oxidoreductase